MVKDISASGNQTTSFLRLNCPNKTAGSVKITVLIEDSEFFYTRSEIYNVNFRYCFKSDEAQATDRIRLGFASQQISSVDEKDTSVDYDIIDGSTSLTTLHLTLQLI